MNVTIVDVKYKEMKKTLAQIPDDQALVIGALAVERLWKPFLIGISKCAYFEQEREAVIQLEGKCLDIIWTRMQRGFVQESDWEEYCELFDQIEELSAEVDLNYEAKSFYCAVGDFAYWCLKPCEKIEVAGIAVCALELMVELMAEPEDVTEEDQTVNAEIRRINTDIELARNYPENIDLIMQKRAEYHDLNINSVCS